MRTKNSLVCYSLPGSSAISAALCKTSWKNYNEISHGEFIVSAFDKQQKLLVFQTVNTSTFPPDIFRKKWHIVDNEFNVTDKDDYIALVNRAKREIKNQKLTKVIASRQVKIPLPELFDPFEFFLNLLEKYPNAFLSLISCPEYGTWIGASPELLISSAGKQLELHSLAGTFSLLQHNDNGLQQKNMKEQELVSVYIRDMLNTCKLDFTEKGPEPSDAGNVTHLKTVFKIDSQNNDCGLKLLEELHPTPAICGYPYQAAKEFIDHQEANRRELYGGFLGNFNSADDFWFYVNLRCMKLLKNEAILYAGAGIVDESDAEMEWYETENKLNTLRILLH